MSGRNQKIAMLREENARLVKRIAAMRTEIAALVTDNGDLRAALAKLAKAMECEPEKLLAALKGDDA